MASSPILQIPELAPTQTDKTTTINDMIIAIENATQAQVSYSFAGGDVSLTTTQFVSATAFKATGLTAAQNLIIPLQPRVFGVINTSSTHALTVKGASGATVVIAASSAAMIQCDGTNCVLWMSGGPGPTGPTGPSGQWTGGTVTALGASLNINSGTIDIGPIAAHDLLANTSGGSATPAATALTALIDAALGSTQGDVLYRGASVWTVLGPGTAGAVLQSGGAGANPSWVNLLAAVNAWTAAQRGVPVVLTDAASITSDFNTGNNFSVTLGGNRTLANPSNVVAGQAGQIVIHQDATGSRTLSYGSDFKFAGGTAPVLTAAANAIDILSYYVIDSTHIAVSSGLNFS